MAKMWLNKGIMKQKNQESGVLRGSTRFKHLGSGIQNLGSGVMFFLRNFFYTFKKKKKLKLD